MSIRTLRVGAMDTNCYLISDDATGALAIVDPGEDGDYVVSQAVKDGGRPAMVLLTHGHFDHILAASHVAVALGIPVRLAAEDHALAGRMRASATHFLGHEVTDPSPVIDRMLADNERIQVGSVCLSVLAVPGHTPGSVAFMVPEQGIITGDLMFADGGIGRTDFAYSDPVKLKESIGRILRYPDDTVLYPGHGPATTVGRERPYHMF